MAKKGFTDFLQPVQNNLTQTKIDNDENYNNDNDDVANNNKPAPEQPRTEKNNKSIPEEDDSPESITNPPSKKSQSSNVVGINDSNDKKVTKTKTNKPTPTPEPAPEDISPVEIDFDSLTLNEIVEHVLQEIWDSKHQKIDPMDIPKEEKLPYNARVPVFTTNLPKPYHELIKIVSNRVCKSTSMTKYELMELIIFNGLKNTDFKNL